MSITREKTDLDKKPIWWLFLGANVLVVLACAITWILASKHEAVTLWYLPTLICNLLSMVLAGLFGYFEIKDFAPQVMHFRRKWLKFYIAAFSVYVASILFNVLFFLFYINPNAVIVSENLLGWQWWVYLMVTIFFSLVAMGLQRFARFKIDLDIYKRKHGENQAQKEEEKKAENAQKNDQKIDQKTEQKVDKKDPKNKPKKSGASGGLLDQME